MWRATLRADERQMLDRLVTVYPQGMTRESLVGQTGFTPRGGTFGTYLGTLRTTASSRSMAMGCAPAIACFSPEGHHLDLPEEDDAA